MTGNLIVHIVLGFIGTQIFTLTISGVFYCLSFVTFTQASEMYRTYKDDLKKLKKDGETQSDDEYYDARSKLYGQILQNYGENFFLYAAIVFLAAELARWGGV